jgi:hypothetical protein
MAVKQSGNSGSGFWFVTSQLQTTKKGIRMAKAAHPAVARTTHRLTNGTSPFFQRDGQWYGPDPDGTAQPICHVCLRSGGDPTGSGPVCNYCGWGIERAYPRLRQQRIELLRAQLKTLETAALEDMWRR